MLRMPENEYDLVNKKYVDEATTPIEYPADSIALITGTLDSGDVTDIQTKNDSNVYHVDEVTGTPGFSIEVTFTGVTHFNSVKTQQWYMGSATHVVNLQLWNYDTLDWDTIGVIQDESAQTPFEVGDIDHANYIQNEEAKVRYYHATSGNASHEILIDYCSLWNSFSTSTSTSTENWQFTIIDPNKIYNTDTQVFIGWAGYDLTIDRVQIQLDATTNQVAGDLKYADDFISLANPIVINDFDTTSGVRDDTSITSASVVRGKAIYLQFDSEPHEDIKQMHVRITFKK